MFNHVNYEDPDINVAIPVFSIHGNHDEPTGQGFYCALEVLQMAGLLNYFGRVPKNEKIEVKPILLQKGHTKLALYGLSNVRDERLFRVFRNNDVKFFQPHGRKDEWCNIMTVHQNHHARTVTGYLPESFLPDFVDLVIWGHEHECLIDPVHSSEGNFMVSQPGSSVVTQLQKGETGPKYIGLLTVTGKDFNMEKIRLKTPRPFVMRDIVLVEEPPLKDVWKKSNNRNEITRHIKSVIEEMIIEANQEWLDLQEEEETTTEPPQPLLRLRVDHTAPEGGTFSLDNAKRISNDFQGRVANHEEIVLFHQKKKAAARRAADPDIPDAEIIDSLTLDGVKVDELVREFLTAQSLTVLPQNTFGDSVNQFVDKDDKHAMEMFINDALAGQVKNLLKQEDIEQTDITEVMDAYREEREKLFDAGQKRAWQKSRKFKPRPHGYDSELDGPWEDQPGAVIIDENGKDEDDEPAVRETPPAALTRGRGRGRGGKAAASSGTTKKPAAKAKPTTAKSSRSKRRVLSDEEEEDEEESDVNMVLANDDEDEDEEDSTLFVSRTTKKRGATATAAKSRPSTSRTTTTKAATATKRQAKLDFSQSTAPARPARTTASSRQQPIIINSDEDMEDSDDDAFEDAPSVAVRGRR